MGWILHDFRTKFILNIGIGIVSSVILGASCYIMVNNIVSEDLLLQEKNDDAHIHILAMRGNEKDLLAEDATNDAFFVTGESANLAKFEENYRSALADIDSIEAINIKRNHPERSALLDNTRQVLHKYHDDFMLTVQKIKERGFSNYGLEGKFRASAAAVESTLQQEFPQENLRAAMLELRKNEKDFFLANDESYVSNHTASVAAFKQALARTDALDQSMKDRLAAQVDEYQSDFLKVVAIDKEIGLTLDAGLLGEFQSAALQVQPLVQNMESLHKDDLGEMVASSRTDMLLLFSVIIASGVIMSLMITRSISSLIEKIKQSDEREKKLRLELQNANEELLKKDKVKDEFINLAAHELRNPVVPIILNAEELGDELGNNERHVHTIIRNAKKITFLTNSLLDMSRLERGTFRLFREKTNLVALVEDGIDDSLPKISSNKNVQIILDSHLPEKAYFLEIDKIRIEQVLINLLDNAIKFTEQGKIVVRMQLLADDDSNNNSVMISVEDCGSGIEESVRNKLFQKYISSSMKKGIGLGLSLSKAIIEAHGGRIWGENNKDGKGGATFAFTLPIAHTSAA